MKEGMVEKKSKKTLVFVIIAIILVVILAYILIIKPSYHGLVIKAQTQGASQEDIRILSAIISQVSQTGYIQIPVGNQTLTLMTPQFCQQQISSALTVAPTNTTK
jgi:Tfp pilus assembly protein PilE